MRTRSKPHDILRSLVRPRFWPLLLVFLPVTGAELAPEVLLLARIKGLVNRGLSQVPAYVCTQEVSRYSRRKSSHRLEKLDDYQLDVAQIGAKELFARPGDRVFQEKELHELVSAGVTATGLYVMHAQTIFQGEATRFEYTGQKRLGHRHAVTFNYSISQLFSRYRIQSNYGAAIVAMEGGFEADLGSGALLKLEVRAVEIPPLLQIRSALTRIEYEATRLNGEDFMLPSEAVVTITDAHGGESVSKTHFRNCRRYTGQATITF